MKYNQLNDSDSSYTKKNKSFTYLEEHEIDREFQEHLRRNKIKMKDGHKYTSITKNDNYQNMMEEVKAG